MVAAAPSVSTKLASETEELGRRVVLCRFCFFSRYFILIFFVRQKRVRLVYTTEALAGAAGLVGSSGAPWGPAPSTPHSLLGSLGRTRWPPAWASSCPSSKPSKGGRDARHQHLLHGEDLSSTGSWLGRAHPFWEIGRSHWPGLATPRLRALRRGPGRWAGAQGGHSAPTRWSREPWIPQPNGAPPPVAINNCLPVGVTSVTSCGQRLWY